MDDNPKKRVIKPRVKTADLLLKVDELTTALQRERADSENMRRRYDAQYASTQTAVKVNVIRELLPAIDNLERALAHVPKELEQDDYVKGVENIVKQFTKILSDLGVQKIETIGKEFDPALHEAVSMEDGEGAVEVVCEELQPGYRLGDEVIRHAMVKVGKAEVNNL